MNAHSLGALGMDSLPEIQWLHGDDLCDCTFQRIGEWANPYIARTLRIRFCCVWAELLKDYPDYVQEIPGFWNDNTGRFETEPSAWDADHEMPRALWHRQVQTVTGLPLEEVRMKFRDLPAPGGSK
jgi:hypothetical protein